MSNEKVALITGASSGMGAACARAFAAHGYRTGLLARSEKIHEIAEEIGGFAVQGSVTEPEDLKTLVDGAMERWGRIDAVISSTGHPPKGALLSLSDEDWYAGVNLLLMNVVRLARLVTPIMQRQEGGAFVNISTYAAVEPDAAYPISATVRAGLAAYVKLFADAHGPDNIRMNSILPGFIDSFTPNEEVARTIPMRRYGAVGEIAETAVFLCSPEGGYITGQSIRVDGGLSRSV